MAAVQRASGSLEERLAVLVRVRRRDGHGVHAVRRPERSSRQREGVRLAGGFDWCNRRRSPRRSQRVARLVQRLPHGRRGQPDQRERESCDRPLRSRRPAGFDLGHVRRQGLGVAHDFGGLLWRSYGRPGERSRSQEGREERTDPGHAPSVLQGAADPDRRPELGHLRQVHQPWRERHRPADGLHVDRRSGHRDHDQARDLHRGRWLHPVGVRDRFGRHLLGAPEHAHELPGRHRQAGSGQRSPVLVPAVVGQLRRLRHGDDRRTDRR